MPPKAKVQTVRPISGGQLFANDGMGELAGLPNYIVKENMRRSRGQEVRREGWSAFVDPGNFPENTNQLFDAVSASGTHWVIACTPKFIYRYNTASAQWEALNGSVGDLVPHEFDDTADRWEVTHINGYTIFNNGSDLPTYYLIGDDTLTPFYELRELGVSHVGTIAEYQGYLVMGDFTELKAENLVPFFNAPGGSTAHGDGPYDRITNDSILTRTPYRIVWSDVGNPPRFGLSINGTILAGQNQINLEMPSVAFAVGEKVSIGTLTDAEITAVSGVTLTIDQNAADTINTTPVTFNDHASLLTGFDDIVDDGSAILRMLTLKDRLVIYRRSSIYLGATTGNADQPLTFEGVYHSKSIYLAHRWCVGSVNDASHIFAGKEHFHQFNLIRRRPEPVQKLALVEDLFYNNVTQDDDPFMMENTITKELWIFLPDAANKTIAYDWDEDSVSTIDESFSSAAVITPPSESFTEDSDNWFILGNYDKRVLLNGIDTSGDPVYQREGVAFTGTLETGIYGADHMSELVYKSLAVLMSEHPDAVDVKVTIFGGNIITKPFTELGSKTILGADQHPLLEMHFKHLYYRHRLEFTGNADARYGGVVVTAQPVLSKGITR